MVIVIKTLPCAQNKQYPNQGETGTKEKNARRNALIMLFDQGPSPIKMVSQSL
jgi:hypothetical protein